MFWTRKPKRWHVVVETPAFEYYGLWRESEDEAVKEADAIVTQARMATMVQVCPGTWVRADHVFGIEVVPSKE